MFINVIVYINTVVCMLRLVVCPSLILMFRINVIPFLFFLFVFLFGYGIVKAPPLCISAADNRFNLDFCISKCYDAASNLLLEIAT